MSSSSALVDLIKKFQDSQAAEINLQLKDGGSVQLKCVYKVSDAPHFFLVFPPKQLPTDIDTGKSCLVAVKGDENSSTFKAGIEAIKGDRIMELCAQMTIDPLTLRTAYRADLRTAISASYEPGPEEKAHAWAFEGQTLDLSAGGTLALFPSEFENKQRILLHIHLPYIEMDIHCVAHVIRMTKIRKERWQIALQFDNLSQKERDCIVSCCLKEQRKQLRENIRLE